MNTKSHYSKFLFVLITLSLCHVESIFCEEADEDCLEEASAFFLNNPLTEKPSSAHVIDKQNVIYICERDEALASQAFHANRVKDDWQIVFVGDFYCLQIVVKNQGSGEFLHQDTCPSRYYHTPSCESFIDSFAIKNGQLKFTGNEKRQKAVCRICGDKKDCQQLIEKEARKLYRSAKHQEAYDLLMNYFEHFRDGIENGLASLTGSFISDLTLMAAKAGIDCQTAIDLAQYVKKWSPKERKSYESNQLLCKTGKGNKS